MKLFTLGFLLSLFATVAGAQTITGKVISSTDKQPIPFATVKLKRSNTNTQTNSNGEFKVEKQSAITTDTLLISSIGYKSLKVATNNIPASKIFQLDADQTTLNEVGVDAGTKKFTMLNSFDYAVINYTMQKDTAQSFISSKFPIAKAFTAEVDSFKLEEIHIGRFIEKMLPKEMATTIKGPLTPIDTRNLVYELKKHVKTAIFNIYIIDSDSAGNPLALDEAKKIPISLTQANPDTKIDLTSYNIRPKHRLFYIAIEWLPTVANQNYSWGKRADPRIYREMTLPRDKKLKNDRSPDMAMVYEIGYEPYVSSYNTLTQNATAKFAWIENKWIVINPDPHAKFNQELAISSKISYYAK